MDGSTRDSASTASTEWKKRRAAAAVALRDLDAHDAELEQLVDERARDLRVLVHLAHERPDFAIRELVDAVAEQPFVFGQCGQRREWMSVGVLRGHDRKSLSLGQPSRDERRPSGDCDSV